METDRDRAQPPIGVIDPREPPNVRRAIALGPDAWSLLRRLGAAAPAGMRPFGLITRLDAMLRRFPARGVAPAWDLAAEAPDPVELRLDAWERPGDDAYPTRWERRRAPADRKAATPPAPAPAPHPPSTPAPAAAPPAPERKPSPVAKPRPPKIAGARDAPAADAGPSGKPGPAERGAATTGAAKPSASTAPTVGMPEAKAPDGRPGDAGSAAHLPGSAMAGRVQPMRPRPSSRRFVPGGFDAREEAPDSRRAAGATPEAAPIGFAPRIGPGGGPRPAQGSGRAPLLPPALMARVLLAFPEAAFAPRTTAGAERAAGRVVAGIGAAVPPLIATPGVRARPVPFDPDVPDREPTPRPPVGSATRQRRRTQAAVRDGGAPPVLPIARRAAPVEWPDRPVLAIAPVDGPGPEARAAPAGRRGRGMPTDGSRSRDAGTHPGAGQEPARPSPTRTRPRAGDAATATTAIARPSLRPRPAGVTPSGPEDGPVPATRVARKPVAAGSLTLGVHVPPIGREPPARTSMERGTGRPSEAPVPAGRFADARTLPMALLSAGRPGDVAGVPDTRPGAGRTVERPSEAARPSRTTPAGRPGGPAETAGAGAGLRVLDTRPVPGRDADGASGPARPSRAAPADHPRPPDARAGDGRKAVAPADAAREPAATKRTRRAPPHPGAAATATGRPGPLVVQAVPPGPEAPPGHAPAGPGAPLPERASPRDAWDPRLARPETMSPAGTPAAIAASAPGGKPRTRTDRAGAGRPSATEPGVPVDAFVAPTMRPVRENRPRAPGADRPHGARPATRAMTPYGATATSRTSPATEGAAVRGSAPSPRADRSGRQPNVPTILPVLALASPLPDMPAVATRDEEVPRAATFARFADAVAARILPATGRRGPPSRVADGTGRAQPARGGPRQPARAGVAPAGAPIGDVPHALVAGAEGAWPGVSRDQGRRLRGGDGDSLPGGPPVPHARPAAAALPTLPGLPRPSTVTWSLAAATHGGGGSDAPAGLPGAQAGPGQPAYRDGWPLVATSLAAVSMTARLATRESGPPSPQVEQESSRETGDSGGGVDLDSLAEEMASRILRRLKREKERRGVHA